MNSNCYRGLGTASVLNMSNVQESEQYSKETNDITVTVTPEFIASESEPDKGIYIFSYTVRFANKGKETIQLINRHWVVMSGSRQIADVKGEGVVGEQPVLKPGESYEYTSGTVIRDQIGSMYGTYTFVSESGEFFDAEIPKFDLIYVDKTSVH